MKKQLLMMMGAVFIMLYSLNVYANGLAIATDNLEAVGSDGPFDVKRNPAAMSLEKEKKSADIFITGVKIIHPMIMRKMILLILITMTANQVWQDLIWVLQDLSGILKWGWH